ncbi:hypothetical protein VTO42DRAFT_3724 [Malbranchea cinnamomea]
MRLNSILSCALAAASTVSAGYHRDTLRVPACPGKATVKFDKSVPDRRDFPRTHVDLCYDKRSLHLTFKAFEEEHFYFDPDQGINDDIWMYNVMEAFIHRGDNDPQTYLEFEVNPNNVTYQAFIYNPSKVRAEGAAFDHFFVSDPAADGFSATTELDRERQTWVSDVVIPLGLFNVDQPRGTRWRMNFFRTITSPETFPDQELGGWKTPDEANFHITEVFGKILFV